MKIIIAVVCITFIYVFSMVNLESFRNHQLNQQLPNHNITENVSPDGSNENVVNKISVTIEGEVLHPGTYIMNSNSTFDDLIKLGGLTQKSADESCYNLDYVLKDKMTYYIPKNGDSKISINSADKDTLVLLRGIGEATADRIVKYRDENGYFECLEDIKNVPGIKEYTFNKIRDFIKL